MKLNFKSEKNFKVEHEFMWIYRKIYRKYKHVFDKNKWEVDLNFYYIVERILLLKTQIHFQIFQNLMKFIEIKSGFKSFCKELEFSFILYKWIYKNITETLYKII